MHARKKCPRSDHSPSPRRLVEVVSRTRHRSRDRLVDRRGPRARRARRQGRRQAGRHRLPCRARCGGADRHRARSRGRRHHPALDRAFARACGEGAVSRRAGHHRAGDRERLLLRLLVQAAFYAGRSRGHRKANDRDREERSSRRKKSHVAGRSGRLLSRTGREVQGRNHRLDSREGHRSRSTARATGSTCAAARTCLPPAS